LTWKKIFQGNSLLLENVEELISANIKSLNVVVSFYTDRLSTWEIVSSLFMGKYKIHV